MRRSVLVAVLVAAVAVAAALSASAPGTSAAWTASVRNGSDTAASSQWFTCADAAGALAPSAAFAWGLNEPATAPTAQDSSGHGVVGTYRGTHATAAVTGPGGCSRDIAASVLLDGASWVASGRATGLAPLASAFTITAWIRTRAGYGGAGDVVLLCAADSSTAQPCGSRDLRLYLSGAGNAVLAIANPGVQALRSAGSVTDGAWHQITATVSSPAGARLYLDGVDVTATATATGGTAATMKASRTVSEGWWRVGAGDGGTNWPDHNPASSTDSFVYLTAQLSGVAVYARALSASEAASLFAAGR